MTAFTNTRWSLVERAGADDEESRAEALESLCRIYWMPVFAFVRGSGVEEESAKDITQSFFGKLLEKDYLTKADPERGRFRSYLLAMLKNFMADQRDHARRLKRGGGVPHIPLDTPTALRLVADGETPEEAFDRRWAQTLIERVAENLRTEATRAGRPELFESLLPYLSLEPDAGVYAEIGAAAGMSRGAVAMAVHRLRSRFRELIRHEVAETLADPADLDEEMKALRLAVCRR